MMASLGQSLIVLQIGVIFQVNDAGSRKSMVFVIYEIEFVILSLHLQLCIGLFSC